MEETKTPLWVNTLKVSGITIGMFVCCLLSGLAPSKMTCLSDRVNHIVAIYGAGILVGAALLVVLPEAVKIVIDSDYKMHDAKALNIIEVPTRCVSVIG